MSRPVSRPTTARPAWTAVVLAGGRGSRLGGVDKPQLRLEGRSLLGRVLDAIPPTVPVLVVGPVQDVPRPVGFCREQPPFGGPVAAVAAAVGSVRTPLLGLVGGDMPWAGALLTDLADQAAERGVGTIPDAGEALVPVDSAGRRQALCSVLATSAVRAALTRLGDGNGVSMRTLLGELTVVEFAVPAPQAAALRDIDEPGDLAEFAGSPG